MSIDWVIVEADGGSRGNPGPAGYGAVVLDPSTSEVLAERGEFLGVETNNVAEYRGLIAGLGAARELGARRVRVRMDSKLVVEQMAGRWQVKHPSMRPLAREAITLRQSFDEVTFEWIPRELNKRADRLANDAMDRGQGRAPARVAGPTAELRWTPPTGRPTQLMLACSARSESPTGQEYAPRWRFSGRNDVPLDRVGRDEAGQTGGAVLASAGDIAAVVTSPSRRARETARAIAETLTGEVDVLVDDDWAEQDFGVWEGMTLAEVEAAYPDELTAWFASPDTEPPGGESLVAVSRRVRQARDRVIARYAGQVVVVVTHPGPIKSLVRVTLDAPPIGFFRLDVAAGSLSNIGYFPDGTPLLRAFNDTAHLRA